MIHQIAEGLAISSFINRRSLIIMKAVTLLGSISLAVLVLLTASLLAQDKQNKSIDPTNFDLTASPNVDFFKFSEGGWISNNPVPSDRNSWGSFDELRDKNQAAIRSILDEATKSADAKQGSNLQKVRDFYMTGMDSVSIEKKGVRPLQPEFDRIKEVKTAADLQKEIARIQTLNIGIPFNFGSTQDSKNTAMRIIGISQSGLSLPEKEYYTKTDEESKKIRDQFVEHVTKMFELLGDNHAKAQQEAKTILDFETQLANGSKTSTELRDPEGNYHKMTLEELGALTPNISWKTFLADCHVKNPSDFDVNQPDFMKQVNTMLTTVPVDAWKTYFRWQVVSYFAPVLNSAFVDESFQFNDHILNGTPAQRPRWRRVLGSLNGLLGEALGELYVQKYFPPEAKARAKEMIANLRSSLREHIQNLTWMSDETKQKAVIKLDAFAVKVGYPDKWRDYSSLKIDRESYVMNVLRANQFAYNYDINRIGKPTDRTEWGMTPQTVNAGYNPLENDITFPAGILQPPFFDPNADDAVNYGGIGGGIGHEMTHGFDDEGRQYDAVGNLKDWWTPEDTKKYTESASLMEQQLNEFVAVDTIHLKGKLMLGEAIADLGGLTIAYSAWQKSLQGKPAPEKIDGYTPEQRFFLGWAQVWRNNIRPQALKVRLNTDPHPPATFRVNAVFSDMPEFYNAFNVKDGDPMMKPADKRPKIW
jgi:putative endopeptidase